MEAGCTPPGSSGSHLTSIFSFIRQSLVDISYVVEIGDIIDWNSGYWEISSISENQLIGGQTDFNHSVVCNAFLV